MTIYVSPEMRESQLSAIVAGLDRYYAIRAIDYAQLEEAMSRMSEDDLHSAVAYAASPDLIGIATAVLAARGTPGTAPPQSPTPQLKEVLF